MKASLLLLIVPAGLLAQEAYQVQPGDTVLRLGWKYGVNPEAIREANHLRSDSLPVGREIILPITAKHAEPVAPSGPVAIRAIPVVPAAPRVLSTDVKERLLNAARELASLHIQYNEAWTPPGQRIPWRMDCSNTARYLYEAAEGIDLGRTASDQYEFLRRRRRAWGVPVGDDRMPSIEKLRPLLRAGDLLFWENTYRPERHSPITHVMIFLGENGDGRWIMAGSRGRHAGGPNIYPFDPRQPAGGYSFFFGLIHHTGRFIAYGRPVT